LDVIDLAQLLAEASPLDSLDRAFRWALDRAERGIPDDVVIQDEYTHDVLFRFAGDCYLVFDTT
jgi:hypothetical protein